MTESERQQAAAIVAGWVWQPETGHHYRFEHAVKTLTRYVEAVSLQPDELKIVIEYLSSQTFSDGIGILNKSVDLGSGWKASDAWIQTMPGDKWANTESTRVRIYQVLTKAPSGSAGDGPYVVENGCQYKVSHTFYWSVETLPTVPTGTSGEQYTLTGVTRDRETGLFTACLEKRERVQQDIAEYTQRVTTFETQKEEVHLGVKQNQVATTGQAARSGGGVLVTRKLDKNPDCTTNVTNQEVTETAVSEATVEYRKTLRGQTKTVVDRNQVAGLTGEGLAVGETRRTEVTEAGRHTNTRTTTERIGAGNVAEGCESAALTHTDTATENLADKPTIEQGAGAVNVTVEKTARRTEEDTWDVTTRRTTYSPATATATGGTTTRTEVTTVGVNQTAAPEASPGVNKQVEVSVGLNDHGSLSTTKRTVTYRPDEETYGGGTVGRPEQTTVGINQTSVPTGTPGVNQQIDVNVNMNDHGSLSTSKRVLTFVPDSRTVVGGTTSHTDVTTVGVNQTGIVVETPTVNKQVEVGVNLNDHGSMSTTQRVTTYAPDSRTASGGTTSQTEEVEVGINQTTVPTGSPSQNKRVDVSVGINDHGSMSTTKRTITYNPDSKTATGGTTSQTEEVEVGINQTTVPTGSTSQNKRVDVSVNLNDHGSMSTTKRTITYNPDSKTATGGTTSQEEETVVGINQTTVPTGTPSQNKRVDVSVGLNDHGSLSTTKRTITYKPDKKTVTGGTTSQAEEIEVGINQTTEPTGNPSQNKRVDVSVGINDHGSLSTTKRTITYKPTKVSHVWSDSSFTYRMTSFKNQTTPIDQSGDSVNTSFTVNDHGTVDGMSIGRTTKKSSGGGESLKWSSENSTITAKFFYFKADGCLYSRTVTGKVSRYFGEASAVQNRISGGVTISQIGWHTQLNMRADQNAFGVKYEVTTIGGEVKEDS